MSLKNAPTKPIQLPQEFIQDQAPIIAEQPVSSCPVCKSKMFSLYATGYDYELRTCANQWKFVKCDDCGHVWLNPRPAISELSTIYPPHYYAYDYDKQVNPIARRGKEILDKFKFDSILSHFNEPTHSFLDVGCGNGRFLKLMERRGLKRDQIYGIELGEQVIAKLREQGYRAFDKRVEDIQDIPTNSIDLITMFHVIEHVDEPSQVVEKIATWLRPGGLFAIETPNIDSIDAELFQKSYWGGYHIPRHWNLFNESTLRKLLKDHGFDPMTVSYQTGHSFWMYSIHHYLRYQREWRTLAMWFDPLKGLPALVGFTAFDKLRGSLGQKTSTMLMLARKPM
jgi:2-polyprenyl-3-methyl-5-hydroxy-6-metoxy-1,4-benzoquinol methylase